MNSVPKRLASCRFVFPRWIGTVLPTFLLRKGNGSDVSIAGPGRSEGNGVVEIEIQRRAATGGGGPVIVWRGGVHDAGSGVRGVVGHVP